MMHMWMWFGYDVGEFMFSGLEITSRWSFAFTWVILFLVALLFEGSKVYLAKVQRLAHQQLVRHRSDERSNLLWGDQVAGMEPTTSRNAASGQMTRWASLRVKLLVNVHQTLVFIAHNVVGYLLMLAVMIYNVYLILAVVFGMMLGYFLFGTKLTMIQMRCLKSKKVVVCTPECDDTAKTTTPPLLDSSSESDYFVCQTRTCIQPSHYFRASTSQESSSNTPPNATCYYGAKKCPSKVARVKRLQESTPKSCGHTESEKDDTPSVEDVQLLRTERQGCCKKKQVSAPVEKKCCKSSQVEVPVDVHESKSGCCQKENVETESHETNAREASPQTMCCHKTKSVTAESQEQIIK